MEKSLKVKDDRIKLLETDLLRVQKETNEQKARMTEMGDLMKQHLKDQTKPDKHTKHRTG